MPPKRNYIQTATGRKVPGITTQIGVLSKPALLWWAYKQGNNNYEQLSHDLAKLIKKDGPTVDRAKIENLITGFEPLGLYEKRDEAANAGTLAHLMIENYLRKLPEPKKDGLSQKVIDKAEGCFLTFLDWEPSELEIIGSEVPLTSELVPCGCTIDHVIRTNYVKSEKAAVEILDVKTAKDIFLEAKIQVAMNKEFWQEKHPDQPVRRIHILRLGPNGEFNHATWPSLDSGYARLGYHCIDIYQILKNLGEKL